MSWISDRYAEIKTLWHRFEQWERRVLLREKEWNFPIYGTLEEFEQRFQLLVPVVSRDEFFSLYRRLENPTIFGFCTANEVALKVPKPQASNPISHFFLWRSSVHYFHGTLTRNDGDLYLFGHYRLPRIWVNRSVGAINAGLILGTCLLLVAFAGLAVELLTGAETEKLIIFIALIPFAFAPALIGVALFLAWSSYGKVFKFLDRHAQVQTHRILTQICGSSAELPSNQTE